MTEVNIHSLKALVIFKTLYETGGASAAARTLGITQSGVSRSLGQLEENLGIQLYLREKNRLVPTPEAHELYREILRLMGNIEELRHSVLALKEYGVSRLRVAAVPGLSFGLIPRLVANLLQRHQRLSVTLDMMSSHDVQLAIESGQADVGFATMPINSAVMVVEPWFKTRAVCLLPADHALASHESVDVTDLAGQHLVISNQPSANINPLLEMVKHHRVQIAGKTEANIGTIAPLVANGAGITVLNRVTALDYIARRDDIVIREFAPTIEFSFGLLYRGEWKQSVVLDLLREKALSLYAEYDVDQIDTQ